MEPKRPTHEKKVLIGFLAVAFVGWVVYQIGHWSSEELVSWSDDPKLLVGSRDSDRPLTLVEFTSRGCAYCEKMAAEVFTRKDVAIIADKFVRVRLDYDQHPTEVDRFNVMMLPSFAVIDPRGNAIHSVQGYLPPDRFIRFLERAQIKWKATKRTSSPSG